MSEAKCDGVAHGPCKILPPLCVAELRELEKDIKENGQLEPNRRIKAYGPWPVSLDECNLGYL